MEKSRFPRPDPYRGGYGYKSVSTAGQDLTISTGPGVVHRLICTVLASGGSIDVYDGTVAAGTLIGSLDLSAKGNQAEVNIRFKDSLHAQITTGGTCVIAFQ